MTLPLRSPETLLRKYLKEEKRAERNRRIFNNNLKEHETERWAIGKIIWDVQWYSAYHWETTLKVVEQSELSSEFSQETIRNIFEEGKEAQMVDGHYGECMISEPCPCLEGIEKMTH